MLPRNPGTGQRRILKHSSFDLHYLNKQYQLSKSCQCCRPNFQNLYSFLLYLLLSTTHTLHLSIYNNTMKLIIPLFFLFLIFTFNVFYVFQGEALITQGVPPSGSSATITGGCEKQRGEYKEERSGSEESVLENEDYVYTNSLP
ncbi:uncharacterized protein HKW66_Vig0012120 [Vigna angularis]|uniref:Transmembrane protein n=2 Tax=Phaseolus angularis TaxID=3914 RepID=A0A8T0LEW7_PHAAN|nr:uncharacterized protein HKW66_Vig0012120 [Vigna angularis]BAT73340.1 hypothetical protein VIGAN_01081400 [Vigna angularis var. angularis]